VLDLDALDETPDVVIDLDRVRANVERAARLAAHAGIRLRPHAKTHKMIEVARLQLEAGATGLQVAKLGEAEVFAEAGVDDLFVGYPLVGMRKLERLRELDADVTVAVDSLEVARALADSGRPLRVLIEVDTGLHRTGLPPGRPCVELALELQRLPNLELVGVFTHEGQIYSAAEQAQAAHDAFDALVETAEEIRAQGIALPVVSAGSTGGFRYALEHPGITEVRPGTYVFNDASQVAQGSATWDDVAAYVVATVVARPAADRVVVDAGSKVLTNDRLASPEPRQVNGTVLGHDGLYVTRLSEEHGVIDGATDLRVGDRIAVVPNHICPVINLTDTVCVVENGTLAGRWRVAARGRVR
jgi:D-serine deaminase-like pyridoxal phosphate-dependent protein